MREADCRHGHVLSTSSRRDSSSPVKLSVIWLLSLIGFMRLQGFGPSYRPQLAASVNNRDSNTVWCLMVALAYPSFRIAITIFSISKALIWLIFMDANRGPRCRLKYQMSHFAVFLVASAHGS